MGVGDGIRNILTAGNGEILQNKIKTTEIQYHKAGTIRFNSYKTAKG